MGRETMRVLKEIYNKDGISTGEIGENLGKTLQTTRRMTVHLVSMGFIKTELIKTEKVYPMKRKMIYRLIPKQKSRAIRKMREVLGNEFSAGDTEDNESNQENEN